jgi:hypothetical protein
MDSGLADPQFKSRKYSGWGKVSLWFSGLVLSVILGLHILPGWPGMLTRDALIYSLIAAAALFLLAITLTAASLVLIAGRRGSIRPASAWSRVIKASGLVLLWFLVSLPIGRWVEARYNDIQFDVTAWHQPDSANYSPDSLTPRQRMLSDLTQRVLPGLQREAIETLLGTSIDSGYFRELDHDLIYVLGPERGFGVDSEWLLIWLDGEGYYERHELRTD